MHWNLGILKGRFLKANTEQEQSTFGIRKFIKQKMAARPYFFELLNGSRLKGRYCLTRFRSNEDRS